MLEVIAHIFGQVLFGCVMFAGLASFFDFVKEVKRSVFGD